MLFALRSRELQMHLGASSKTQRWFVFVIIIIFVVKRRGGGAQTALAANAISVSPRQAAARPPRRAGKNKCKSVWYLSASKCISAEKVLFSHKWNKINMLFASIEPKLSRENYFSHAIKMYQKVANKILNSAIL